MGLEGQRLQRAQFVDCCEQEARALWRCLTLFLMHLQSLLNTEIHGTIDLEIVVPGLLERKMSDRSRLTR